MELIYSIRRKPLKCEPPHYERYINVTDPSIVRPLVTISTCNIIAFTSPTELNDLEGDTWGGYVYVCDLDTPWDSHKVTSTVHPVTALEWDEEGKQLVVATAEGEVNMYGMKDHLLNQWQCVYGASFPGEPILSALPFSAGRRVSRAAADGPAAERAVPLRPVPTLKGFGGSAVEGCACVSAHGAVCIVSRGAGGAGPALTASETLRTQREHVISGALAHSTNGSFLIAALTNTQVVRVSRGTVSGAAGWGAVRPAPPQLTLHAMTAVTLPGLATSVTWSISDECSRLIVSGAVVSAYTLTDTRHPVHSLLNKGPAAGNTTPGGGPKTGADSYITQSWVGSGAWAGGGGGAAAAARGRHALVGGGALHLLTRDMHHVCSRALPTLPPAGNCSPPKKTKYGVTQPEPTNTPSVSSVCISHLCGVCVCVDARAHLAVYRLPPPWPDATNTLAVQLASAQLEWVMVAAIDPTDVLLVIRPKLMELVYERFTETFQRQPAAYQQYYHHAWMKIRMALARSMPSSSRLSAITSSSAAVAAWAALSAAARDAPADDRLAAVVYDAPDQEKALLALEAKSEGVCSIEAVGALRRMSWRAMHTALTALACLAHGHSYELWSEPSAILTLRKILAVGRGAAGGGGGEAAAGRMLARALHAPLPLKQELQEEISSLCSVRGRVWDALQRTAVSAPHGAKGPYMLEYGSPPAALRVSPEPPPPAADAWPGRDMDSIRYLYLGGGPLGCARWRGCGRCGARGAPAPAPPAPPPAHSTTHKWLARAHDARFMAACRCGGKWTMFSNYVEVSNNKCKINN